MSAEEVPVAYTKRLSRVGNSAGLTFDQPILKLVGWEIGTEVDIRVDGEQLILTPNRYARPGEVDESARRMIAKHQRSLDKLGR
jgi:antitoxin component of MazEF toxin-antitoxin module